MPEPIDNPDDYYVVREHDGRFEVRTASGRSIMLCGDSRSASHYASLLNEAFHTGFKMGYREGREVSK